MTFHNSLQNSATFQAWKAKKQNSMTFQVFQDPYEPWYLSDSYKGDHIVPDYSVAYNHLCLSQTGIRKGHFGNIRRDPPPHPHPGISSVQSSQVFGNNLKQMLMLSIVSSTI